MFLMLSSQAVLVSLAWLPHCLSLAKLDTADHNFDSWDTSDSAWDLTGQTWNPARLVTGYQYEQKTNVDREVIDKHDEEISEKIDVNEAENGETIEQFSDDSSIEDILLNHTFERIVQRLSKDNDGHRHSEEGSKEPISEERTVQATRRMGGISTVNQMNPPPNGNYQIFNLPGPTIQQRSQNEKPILQNSVIPMKTNHHSPSMLDRLKTFMLNKLVNTSDKKIHEDVPTKKETKIKLKSSVFKKHESYPNMVMKPAKNVPKRMPTFPNFPQIPKTPKFSHNGKKESRENIFHKHNPSNNKSKTKEVTSFIHKFPVDSFGESDRQNKVEQPYKIESQKIYNPASTTTTNPYLIFNYNTKQSSEATKLPPPSSTFAPLFSVTPFVTSFGSYKAPEAGRDNRRTFKATPRPPTATEQDLDMEIFRQYFSQMEIKKISAK